MRSAPSPPKAREDGMKFTRFDVARHNVEGVPTLEDTHDAPDEGLRCTAREHYGSREG